MLLANTLAAFVGDIFMMKLHLAVHALGSQLGFGQTSMRQKQP